MIKFFFDFVSSGHGKRYIVEPTGFREADFTIEQEEGRFGRDVQFAGGEQKLTIHALPQQCFDEIMYNKQYFGYESIVKFGVEFDETTTIIGEIDFYTATTDGVNYFEFTVIEESQRALLKTRYDAKTSLLSAVDLDGNPIMPVPYTSMLLKAKPLRQKSIWTNPELGKRFEFNPMSGADYINPVRQQKLYGIEDSLTWIEDRNNDTGELFAHVEAANNLLNLNVTLNHNVTWQYVPFGAASQRQGSIRIRVVWGQSIDLGILSGQTRDLYYRQITGNTTQNVVLPLNMTAEIPFVNATDRIWIGYTVGSLGSSQVITFQECTTEITASSVAFNTVVPVMRMIDAMKYVVKASSGLTLNAPRYDAGGELYNQYITTSSLMRRLFDKPINASFKDIVEDWICQEMADYSLRTDNSVYVGFYKDYYPNVEIGSYNQKITDDYSERNNERYAVNILKYGYKNYASQKENSEGNTYDIVHGDSQWLNGNKKAKNTKDISIGLVLDAFLLELNRRNAYDLTNNTATQDDEKIFRIDSVNITDEDRTFTNTALLRHQVLDGSLVLTNNGKFSWIQLGIEQTSTFVIDSTVNSGSWFVLTVNDSEMRLISTSGVIPQNISAANTTFTYTIPNSVLLVNRTNEGFDLIQNIEEPDNFSNLLYTVARNIRKYCSEYLATCIFYSKDKPYKNTLYRNNPKAKTRFISPDVVNISDKNKPVTEGEDFTPINPILEPTIITTNLIMTRKEWLLLQDRIRNENGFVRTHKSNGMPVKLYIKKGTWTSNSKNPKTSDEDLGYALIDGEVKYDPFYIEIFGVGDGLILINSQGIGISDFNYDFDRYENLLIFDEVGKLMFNPTPYNRVKVNNSSNADSTVQLQQWLNNLL